MNYSRWLIQISKFEISIGVVTAWVTTDCSYKFGQHTRHVKYEENQLQIIFFTFSENVAKI